MLKKYIPKLIIKGQVFGEIYNSQQWEIDKINGDNEDLLNQCFIDTATWSLLYWEEKYGLETDETDTLENRRGRVRAKMVSRGQPFNSETIKNIAKAFTNGDVEVTEHLENDYFTVEFVGTMGIPPKVQDVYSAIDDIKASWLGVEYQFKYNTVYDLRQFSVAELSKYSVKQLLEKDLQHGDPDYSILTNEDGNLITTEDGYCIELV